MTMISRIPNFYGCPKCNQYYAEPRLISVNDFWDLYYFDGYHETTINTLNTEFVQCCSCDLVFRRNELIDIDEGTINQEDWGSFNRIKKPKIDFYLQRIDESKHSASDELNTRLEAMWEYNHAFRGMSANSKAKQTYHSVLKEKASTNEKRLLEILSESDSHIMIKADIHRRHKQFDEAKRLIRSINSEEFRHTRTLFIYLCTREITDIVDTNYEPCPHVEKLPPLTAGQKNNFWDDKLHLTFATSPRLSLKEVVITSVIFSLSCVALYLLLSN